MKERKRRRRRLIGRKAELVLKFALLGAAVLAVLLLIIRAAGVPVPMPAPAVRLAEMTRSVFARDFARVQEENLAPEAGGINEMVPHALSGAESVAEEPEIIRPEGSSPPSEEAKRKQVEEEDIALADVSGDWRLVLVNPTRRMPDDYEVDTCLIKEGEVERIDWRVFDDLTDMILDCERADHSPVIRAAYRTHEMQQELYDQKVQEFINEGQTEEEARKSAATIVALPGTSEHELGLAVDIVSGDNSVLNEAQEDTPTQKWLMEHSWEYGFILRYPTDKSLITGIIYEPWHYRYVGKEAAKVMHEQDLCLEEYLYAHGNGGRDGET